MDKLTRKINATILQDILPSVAWRFIAIFTAHNSPAYAQTCSATAHVALPAEAMLR
jgi:hypothetical protein